MTKIRFTSLDSVYKHLQGSFCAPLLSIYMIAKRRVTEVNGKSAQKNNSKLKTQQFLPPTVHI